MPRSHSRPVEGEYLGMGPEHVYFLMAPQLVLMHSPDWEPLVQINAKGFRGAVTLKMPCAIVEEGRMAC